MTTSDVQLLNIAKKLGVDVQSVSTRDNMPKKLSYGFHILNIGSRASGGTHWTGAFKGRTGVVYFDSFGAPPPTQIEQALRKHTFTNWVIQDVSSKTCGYFVLAFGAHMVQPHHGVSDTDWANAFVNQFGEDTNENERIVKRLLS